MRISCCADLGARHATGRMRPGSHAALWFYGASASDAVDGSSTGADSALIVVADEVAMIRRSEDEDGHHNPRSRPMARACFSSPRGRSCLSGFKIVTAFIRRHGPHLPTTESRQYLTERWLIIGTKQT